MTDRNPYDQLSSALLTESGLNMQAVFALDQLPLSIKESIRSKVPELGSGGSLLLVGNGGPFFWRYLNKRKRPLIDPVDRVAVQLVNQYVSAQWPQANARFLYPGKQVPDLQHLGKLAGWHHDSPLKIGINPTWGLWFAYRALVVLDNELPVTSRVLSGSPCDSCVGKPCIQSCPANALEPGEDYLKRCGQYRVQAASSCKSTCLARLACPVQVRSRYDQSQIHFHYTHSLEHIR
ncbi:MAG: hypothetical protein D6160_11980 [Ketobacter sp.]|nr:MAG: hypothetical protein D6160_11980 [Ketobacter sp.]